MSRYPHKTGPSQGPYQGVVQVSKDYPTRPINTVGGVNEISQQYTDTEINDAIKVICETYFIDKDEFMHWLICRGLS